MDKKDKKMSRKLVLICTIILNFILVVRISTALAISPVYRFWSDQNQSHFYTISETEKDDASDLSRARLEV